ncbi:TPA: type III-B CRISPR module RAMP protein Cmr6, partial [Candidatus Geothermarchaeota archaeon]|nr:type III-B CRISPR module RAMP protein Cmr6 [Candidatus Geothermarchaeota archaeon]
KTNLTIDRSAGPIDIIYEVGLAIHPIFGFPYIPGQSLKGAFTHMMLRYTRFLDNKLKDLLGDKVKDVFTRYIKWFLGHDKSGISNIMFTDAYPDIANNKDRYFISPDIMTPHYKSDTENELDVNPIPILYLVVPKGIRFRFIFGVSNRRVDRLSEDIKDISGYRDTLARIVEDDDLNKIFTRYINGDGEYKINFRNIASDVIDLMLYYGVGGKTNTGYSRFEVLSKRWSQHG